MEVHPIAALFPMLGGDEAAELAADIRANGLREPIKTWNGLLIDGRNRLQACDAAKVIPHFEALYFSNDAEVAAYIVSANIRRRHLNPGQRAFIANAMRKYLTPAAKDRQGEGGGRGHKKTSPPIRGEVSRGGRVNVQLSKMFDVGHGTIARANKIEQVAPELKDKVMSGEMKLDAAYKQVHSGPGKLRLPKGSSEPKIDPATLSATSQQKLETVVRQEKRRLQIEFDRKVQEELARLVDDTVLPSYQKEYTSYRRIIESRAGIMSRDTFRLILGCLHPDRVTDPDLKERYTKAFHAFSDLELVLCEEKEMPTNASSMPRSYEEMMQRRADIKERRKRSSNGVQRQH